MLTVFHVAVLQFGSSVSARRQQALALTLNAHDAHTVDCWMSSERLSRTSCNLLRARTRPERLVESMTGLSSHNLTHTCINEPLGAKQLPERPGLEGTSSR